VHSLASSVDPNTRDPSRTSLRYTIHSMRSLPVPKSVLFDLFHTLASVPPPAFSGEVPISEILDVPRRLVDDG